MIERRFSVGSGPRLDLSIPSGRISIEEGPPGEVGIRLEAPDPDSYEIRQSGDTVTVERVGQSWSSRGSTRLRVTSPAAADAHLATASADIEASVDLGRVTVATASGDVRLRSVAELDAKTASGDLGLVGSAGDLRVRTASGDIRLAGAGGRFEVSTASGDVAAAHVAGSARVSSASGDIRIDRFEGDDAEIKTMSGDVRIGLPAGTRVSLDAHCLSGRIHRPEARSSPDEAARTVRVTARTVSGDIVIDRV